MSKQHYRMLEVERIFSDKVERCCDIVAGVDGVLRRACFRRMYVCVWLCIFISECVCVRSTVWHSEPIKTTQSRSTTRHHSLHGKYPPGVRFSCAQGWGKVTNNCNIRNLLPSTKYVMLRTQPSNLWRPDRSRYYFIHRGEITLVFDAHISGLC